MTAKNKVYAKSNSSSQRGFTLIELLVVISIVGFMSSIVLINVRNARVSARNTQRLNDYTKTAEAFEAYRIDNGTYPPSVIGNYNCLGPATSTCYNYGSGLYFYGDPTVYNALVPQYLQSMPRTNILLGHGLNHPFYIEGSLGGNNRYMYFYTFYEGIAPTTCPYLFAGSGVTNNVPYTSETGYYWCYYYIIYRS